MAVTRINNSGIRTGSKKSDSFLAGQGSLPSVPTIGTATAGNASATVAFTAGGIAGTTYRAISSPGGLTGTSATSPITVSGLTNGTAYTFQVRAENAVGNSAYSSSSNSVTPVVPITVTGGSLSSDATFYYRTFVATNTLSVTGGTLTADIMQIGGAGAGFGGTFSGRGNSGVSGGAGGAGGIGLRSNVALSGSYTCQVGAGGTGRGGGDVPSGGSDSYLSDATGSGGRGGGWGGAIDYPDGGSGGCGGSGASRFISGGSGRGAVGTGTQGFNSGVSFLPTNNSDAGSAGGGGMGGVGANGSSSTGGNGGIGTTAYTSWGNAINLGQQSGGFRYFAGGGGGGGNITNGSGGLGGGGGGTGAPNGQGNLGGGGAGFYGSTANNGFGGNGGSGMIVVRYTRSQVGG